MPLNIIRNDISKVHADVIVNSANPHPICGGGAECPIFSQLVENAPTDKI